MPRYYFHCVSDDAEGADLPDDRAARDLARQTFGEMIRDGSVREGTHMEVVDAAGRRVARFNFSADTA
jgi:hypothetical protein